MSFQKAGQLIELLFMAKGRYQGISLQDVAGRFEVSTRTAQRMLRRLEGIAAVDLEALTDHEGRKRWRLVTDVFRDFLHVTAEDLAALEAARDLMREAGRLAEAKRLARIEDTVRSLTSPKRKFALETDEEALLEAQGLAMRPGPRPVSKPTIIRAIGQALKAVRVLEIMYQSRRDPAPRPRRIEPYGMLYGLRQYVVAQEADDPEQRQRLYRLEGIEAASVTDIPFERNPDFDLRDFSKRAFGTFQNENEYGEVVWKFSADAAEHAKGFLFHPDQEVEELDDGALIVRFKAAGHIEMCWHLYSWGNKVEVLAPQRLREMCRGHRACNFPALP